MKVFFLLVLCALVYPCPAAAVLPAFPGAEGFGSTTPGGRGGKVIQVTNLDDSGRGSLRAALEAEGPRIVVFRVGGTIRLKSHLRIDHPFITVAGQTAPGGGILIRDAGLRVAAHDVVIRCLRIRVGESRAEPDGSQDAISISGTSETGNAYNVVVDHCSFSWAIDENADSYSRASDTTFQWCIFSEGLMHSIHHKGSHSMGMLLGQNSTRTSLHHNLFAHNNQRNPRIKGGRRDVVNNLIYNWGAYAAAFSDDPEVNFVANYYKPGPNSDNRPIIAAYDRPGTLYIRDNHFPGSTASDWDAVEHEGIVQAEQRFHAPLIATLPAEDAYKKVLAGVGCAFPTRDSVDERIVSDVRNGTGRIIDNPGQAGGFPEIRGGDPPVDADSDGMPDSWETSHGLNPHDPSDASADRDGDGYTNVEEYVNGLAP